MPGRVAIPILFLSLLFNAGGAAHAAAFDLRLIQLVPPESQVVAGILSPAPGSQSSSILLITGNNKLDLADFFAVTGADPSRLMHQVVFVAAPGADGALTEHSLLVSGHFNRNAIFRFAENGNARTETYRGVAILIVPPFAREHSALKHERWLAILNSEIAIFGTPQSVQRELDRQIANIPPDTNLMDRLSRLDRRDQTWCLLPAPKAGDAIARVLLELDPRLAAVASDGGPIQYGVRFGRDVEIIASSNASAPESSNALTNESAAHFTPAHYLPADSLLVSDDGIIAVVKISRRRYDEWLNKFSEGGPATADTLPR